MTAPQPTKRVGAGGCLVSIGVFVLSIVAFVGLLVWAGFSVVNDLQASPGVPLGSTSQVTISNTGTQFLFLGNFEAGGSIPLSNPTVTITSPSGSNVPVTANSSTSGSSGANEFRSVGEFNATATGTYTVEVSSPTISSPSTAGAKVYVTNINVGSLGAKVVLATGVGGLLFILSIVLAIVWLVRRSKASKGTPPPYAGGGPGVPPPGTYPPGAAPPGSYPPGAPPGSPPPAAGPPGWSPGPPHTP